jgi:hypothetical protein
MFKLPKSLTTLNASRGKLFVALVEDFLFRDDQDRFSRSDFTAPGNWDIFLNTINVEAQDGLTEAHPVKALYGIEPTEPIRLSRRVRTRSGSGAGFEAPGIVADPDDLAMMGEAVVQCRGHLGIAEDGRPFPKGEVGGGEDRCAFVEAADQVY